MLVLITQAVLLPCLEAAIDTAHCPNDLQRHFVKAGPSGAY